MTIIAKFGIRRCPMLVADLLISAPHIQPVDLPLVKARATDAVWVPHGLRQKLVVVDEDHLVVGWAGNESTAREVIEELAFRDKIETMTPTSIMEFFNGLNESVWEKIGVIGFIQDSAEMRSFRCDRTKGRTLGNFGQIELLGSEQSTEQTLRWLQDMTAVSPIDDGPALNEVDESIGTGLSLVGSLMGHEAAAYTNITAGYGGGYEIVTALDQKLKKVDDITFAFWAVRVADEQITFAKHPFRACHYSYHGDLLVIQAMKFSNVASNQAEVTVQNFIVPPLLRNAMPEEIASLKLPSFNARYFVHLLFS